MRKRITHSSAVKEFIEWMNPETIICTISPAMEKEVRRLFRVRRKKAKAKRSNREKVKAR